MRLTLVMDGDEDPVVTVYIMQKTEKPTIITEAQTVNTPTVILEGTTEGYADITVTGGAEIATGKANSEGYFSVEVPLQKGAENYLHVSVTLLKGYNYAKM